MKILSVVIPTYNTELYMRRCLDSLTYDQKTLNELDVIVVNDGGTDQSSSIAHEYESKYPKSIRVIDKENGGHGSTINVGVSKAVGKFVKILDSDDWFNIVDLPQFVANLQKETADIVITNYQRVFLFDESEMNFIFVQGGDIKAKPLADAVDEINDPDFFFKFSMPSMAIKTQLLQKNWNDGLLEKTFYVDQQFVAKILKCSSTYAVYDLNIYRHFIGRPEQSIGTESFFCHRSDHERVLRKLLTSYKASRDNTYKTILKKQISLMIKTQLDIYSGHRRLTGSQKDEIRKFKTFLNTEYPEFIQEEK